MTYERHQQMSSGMECVEKYVLICTITFTSDSSNGGTYTCEGFNTVRKEEEKHHLSSSKIEISKQ